QHKIVPPDQAVLGVLGRGVILPCQLTLKTIPQRLSVLWTFAGNSKEIHVASFGGRNLPSPVDEHEAYQGRTGVFQMEFHRGNVSLHLKNVTFSDQGRYTCTVFFDNSY
ncbi:PREDICTED: CD276 antigen homolog, partial [Chaetura pelagica]